MTLSLIDLIVGGGMFGLGLFLIILETTSHRPAIIGNELARVEFVFVGVGMTCLGFLVGLLGLLSTVVGHP